MKLSSPAHIVSVGGILTALAVLFQSAPVFLSGIGLVLSPFATFPIALAAVTSTYSGIIALLTSAFILLFISPQESAIFLLTTGSLGLALGGCYNKGFVRSIVISGLILFIGINALKHIAGIAAFGDITPEASVIVITFIFLMFSFLYSAIWALLLRYFVKTLKRSRIIDVLVPDRK